MKEKLNLVTAFSLLVVGFLLTADVSGQLRVGSPPTALDRYLEKQDESYSWKILDQGKSGKADYLAMVLTSQTWKGTPWKHQLYLIKPRSCRKDCRQGLLLIGGGSWKPELEQQPEELPRDAARMVQVAEQLKSPVAVLLQVPNQPLFDGKYEDQIIAYTFEQFIRSGDDHWPLLLPMVKSAHRAMDTSIQVVREKWNLSLESFTVTGASKRGWTTWLTGATDPRVNAIAPMVIDVLNMKPQMEHQKKAWGSFSRQIQDYTDRGLQDLLSTEKGKTLREIVDPYSYRNRLTQSKLILIGTNDAYWPVDALKFYWDDLKGEKNVVYVPNNGHGLNDFSRIVGSIHGLHLAASGRQAMPKFEWRSRESEGRVVLTMTAAERPDKIQVWSASSDTRDFRKSRWTAETLQKNDNESYTITFSKPSSGSLAFFGEAIFNRDNFPCYLSTNVQVLQADSQLRKKRND
ncbi:MAG: PhoPQ-activated protein PqaA family protein [Planctomycetota bacterium]|nr:PhoPQ-activated protein PqaA family protein [Planctomycetota bacterium]